MFSVTSPQNTKSPNPRTTNHIKKYPKILFILKKTISLHKVFFIYCKCVSTHIDDVKKDLNIIGNKGNKDACMCPLCRKPIWITNALDCPNGGIDMSGQ